MYFCYYTAFATVSSRALEVRLLDQGISVYVIFLDVDKFPFKLFYYFDSYQQYVTTLISP